MLKMSQGLDSLQLPPLRNKLIVLARSMDYLQKDRIINEDFLGSLRKSIKTSNP